MEEERSEMKERILARRKKLAEIKERIKQRQKGKAVKK